MIFRESELAGAWLIDLEPIDDERGFFARTFCRVEFAAHGLETGVAQCNLSYNRHRGTLRGMHFQAAPGEEAKLVRCTRGAIFDVIVDLRPDSATYCRWVGVALSAAERRMLWVPQGLAHGFLTLEDHAEVCYQMSAPFRPELARGVRWNDPAFAIDWPEPPRVISERDRSYPDFTE